SFDGQVLVGRWDQGTFWQPLWNREPFSLRTRYAQKVYQGAPTIPFVGMEAPPLEVTGAVEYVCPAPFAEESGRFSGYVHWWAQAAARTFANWTFLDELWSGVTGKKEDPLLITATELNTKQLLKGGEEIPESSAFRPGAKPPQIII